MPTPKPTRKKIHLVFQSHPEGEPYLRNPPGENVKVHIAEKAVGWPHGKEIRREDLAELDGPAPFEESRKNFFGELIETGRRVVFGESAKEGEREKLRSLLDSFRQSERELYNRPNLKKIRDYFISFAKLNRMRENLIVRTMKEEAEKVPESKEAAIHARYGSAHSMLAGRLRKEGFEVRGEKPTILFTHGVEIMRRLTSAKNLSGEARSIPAEKYLRAFVESLVEADVRNIVQCNPYMRTGEDEIFVSAANRAISDAVPEKELKEIVKWRDSRKALSRLGISPNPINPLSRGALERLISRKSLFWRMRKNRMLKRKEASPRKTA